MTPPTEIIQAWHDALNQGNVDAMMALIDEDVVLGGPRGLTNGAPVVREWFGRANVRLYPLAYFARAQSVVVEEKGEWLEPLTGEIIGTQTVATYFTVEGDLITRLVRYDQLATALSEAGLTSSDRVQ